MQSESGHRGRREATLTGFGVEVGEEGLAPESSSDPAETNAIVPAPVVTLQEVSAPAAQTSVVRVSRPSPLQTVDIGIIISTGEVGGYDGGVEIDATATLHGTAPAPRGLELRRGRMTGALRGSASSGRSRGGEVFALHEPVHMSEVVHHPGGARVQVSGLAADVQYSDAHTATRMALARVAIADDEDSLPRSRSRQSSDPRAVDVSALFYRVDADVLAPRSSSFSSSPTASQEKARQATEQTSHRSALRLRSLIAFYSLLTTFFVALIWGCVSLAVRR